MPTQQKRTVTTPGGYTAEILGPDPQDSSRVKIRYIGQHAWLGEDSYPAATFGLEAPAPRKSRRQRGQTPPPELTVFRPASDPETIEQGLKEGWIQPTGLGSWHQGDLVEGIDDDGERISGQVGAVGVNYLRLTSGVAIYNPKLLHPHNSPAAQRATLEAQITALHKDGPVMPPGSWIEPYTATRKRKDGSTAQYTYYRVKAYEAILEAEHGQLKRSKSLGTADSPLYREWCSRRDRRQRLNELQAQLKRIQPQPPEQP